ncbi:peroxidase-related enzyme [Wohlfahrtiimonas larvae]|uniref:Alkylhydroperoxidase domain protein n=2 Tax=Wohlfahrtiimonas larvae TaxID=1157986 RepID=A0ABP9MT64_9GAMM
MIIQQDLINQLIHLNPQSKLAEARIIRDVATDHLQLAFETIFSTESEHLTQSIQFYLAEQVARKTGSDLLADYYVEQFNASDIQLNPTQYDSALNYVDVIIEKPKQANKALVTAVIESGWHEKDFLLLAQLVTFVTYQARLIEGLLLLNGQSDRSITPPVTAGIWNTVSHTAQGRIAPTAFTQDQLGWESWLNARDVSTLSDEEANVMKKMGQISSEYFLLLAHQSKILELRTLIDRGIFYTPEGLPRWEREYAAAVVSKVNGCIYCASVHARKASHLAKDRKNDIDQLLATQTGEVLAQNFDERLLAITDFSASLSTTPISAYPIQIERLRALGLDELELLDLIQSIAFFSWANRLMLSLGEAYELN